MAESKITRTLSQIPTSVWILGFVSMFMDISSEMIHALLPMFMVTTLGISVLVVGVIEGLGESCAMIVKVFSGTLSDYWRKRKGITVFGYAIAAFSKPLFAIATSASTVLTARLLDRMGKGIRGAPRDALIADITPPQIRGAAFGLRQALDTVGAVLGPLLAAIFLILLTSDFRTIFWIATIPAIAAVVLLFVGVQEPEHHYDGKRENPISWINLKRLGTTYWWVVAIGGIFTLARFSEAFLVLRAQEIGIPIMFVPLVMVAMNVVYAMSAYPFGKLSDTMSHTRLLVIGLLVLIAADIVLALSTHWMGIILGVGLWGIHMGMTQGLLAAMVAHTAPADLRGTAYGFFNLISGVALLVASTSAGLVWVTLGPAYTFYVGAGFCGIALVVVGWAKRTNFKIESVQTLK